MDTHIDLSMRTDPSGMRGTKVVSVPVGADFFMKKGWEGGGREMYGGIREAKAYGRKRARA